MPQEKILISGGSGFIGTNLVEHFLQSGLDVVNADIAAPRNPQHLAHWAEVDLTDRGALEKLVRDTAPHFILHFGARTDLEGHELEDYAANTIGVSNMVEAAPLSPNLRRVIFASSMLVCRMGHLPKNDLDYAPNTVYGRSKVEGEHLVRNLAGDRFQWTIVRPTSIWGPWFDIPYRNFFEAVRGGWYLHPSQTKVRRSYGFVLNSVLQVDQLLRADASSVAGRMFYLADYEPIELGNWADEISEAFHAARVRRVPLGFLKVAARLGDLMKRTGWKNPPLTSTRLSNLTTEAVFELKEVERICGPLPYAMSQGVQITLEWIRNQSKLHYNQGSL